MLSSAIVEREMNERVSRERLWHLRLRLLTSPLSSPHRLSQASESFITAALHICESTSTRHFENEHEMP